MKIKYLRLEEICSAIVDCPHSTPEWKSEGITVIRNFNINNGVLDFEKAFYVDEETYKERTKRATPSYKDLIFSREAPIGAVCMVPDNFKCCLGQRLVLLRVNEEMCSPEYLLYALQTKYVKTQMTAIDKTGSIVSNFNISDLKNLIIPIVEDPTKKSVELLTMIDKLMNLYNERIKVVNQIIKDIYNYWFVQFDFHFNNKPYKSSHGQMKDVENYIKQIPEHWEICDLKEHLTFEKGIEVGAVNYAEFETPPGDESFIKYYRVSDMNDSGNTYIQKKMAGNKLLNHSDVAVSFDGTVGKIGLSLSGSYSSGIRKIYDSSVFLNNAVIYSLFSSEYIQTIMKKYATGSNILHAAEAINNLFVPYNKQTVTDYKNIITPIFDTLLLDIEESKKLMEIRAFILPLLMNGQVK